jgi:hypothetical protein
MNRDLDKKIAELKGCNTKLEESTKQWYCDCEHQIHGYSKYDYTPPYLKLYSSKIEDAWPLFVEMASPKISYYEYRFLDKKRNHMVFDASFCVEHTDSKPGYSGVGSALSASEAICKAWIKWKEAQ